MEEPPKPSDFDTVTVSLVKSNLAKIDSYCLVWDRTGLSKIWSAWNGLNVLDIGSSEGKIGLKVSASSISDDPFKPQFVTAGVSGLGNIDFIKLSSSGFLRNSVRVRCDLIDDSGRRFCIFENYGKDYFSDSTDIYLNIKDFGSFFWGRPSDSVEIDLRKVIQIQLRIMPSSVNTAVPIELSFLRTKHYER